MKQKTFYDSAAWDWCRKYVLLFYSVDGKVRCSTCGKEYQLPDKLIQVGHYHKSDRHRSVALEFHNLAPQCYKCNTYFSGKPDVMYEFLLKQHGIDFMNNLLAKRNVAMKLDSFRLNIYKEFYKNHFKELVKLKGNPWRS